MSKHTVNVTISHGGPSYRLTCESSPGSPCVTWCAEGCVNAWDEGHDEHAPVAVPCMAVEWWDWENRAAFEDGYNGDTTPVRSGPIVLTAWGEDGIEWHYAPVSHESGSESRDQSQ